MWKHIEHLQLVSERLQQFSLKITADKCISDTNKLSFLGHENNETGILPLPEKIATILNSPQPESFRQLRRFIELTKFYRRFLPKSSTSLALLTDSLRSTKKKKKIENSNFKVVLRTHFTKLNMPSHISPTQRWRKRRIHINNRCLIECS